MRNCLQSEDPRYRHDFVVAFAQLLERTLFAAKALLKRAKKESFAWAKARGLHVASLADVQTTRAALSPECQVGKRTANEGQELVEHWEAAQRTLEAIATFLLQSIRTTTSTAALLLVADLLQTLVSRCGTEVRVDARSDRQSLIPLRSLFTASAIHRVLLLLSNQNATIRTRGVEMAKRLFASASTDLQATIDTVVSRAFDDDGL